MGNRKEEIKNLEIKINEKKLRLNDLKAAELRDDPDDDELSPEDIEDIVNQMI